MRTTKYVLEHRKAGWSVEEIAAGLVFHGLSEREKAEETVIRILRSVSGQGSEKGGKNDAC